MQISAIPAFNDNYIWALHNNLHEVFVVDPGDAAPVEEFLTQHQLILCGILITHHHADHTGGIADLCIGRDIPVYGPTGGHIKGITTPLADSDVIAILGRELQVMAVPGHTLDHIAYYMKANTGIDTTRAETADNGLPALFCGDTLFAGGCGRLFEGTAEMMYTSLLKIEALPENSRIYCAHEYTLSNLAFALQVEPDNQAIAQRIKAESDKRDQGLPTLPSTILLERRTNPFLRCHIHALQANVGRKMAKKLSTDDLQSSRSDLETFALLRRWKDQA